MRQRCSPRCTGFEREVAILTLMPANLPFPQTQATGSSLARRQGKCTKSIVTSRRMHLWQESIYVVQKAKIDHGSFWGAPADESESCSSSSSRLRPGSGTICLTVPDAGDLHTLAQTTQEVHFLFPHGVLPEARTYNTPSILSLFTSTLYTPLSLQIS